ncbi:MAG: hypothetical protein K9M56_09805 [Victivallales bacterium]|nr:hypothetical protein [Victivallales bacterium]
MKKAVITILAVFLAFQLYAEQKCFKRSQNTLLYDEVMQNRQPETMESVSAQSDSPVDSGDSGGGTFSAPSPSAADNPMDVPDNAGSFGENTIANFTRFVNPEDSLMHLYTNFGNSENTEHGDSPVYEVALPDDGSLTYSDVWSNENVSVYADDDRKVSIEVNYEGTGDLDGNLSISYSGYDDDEYDYTFNNNNYPFFDETPTGAFCRAESMGQSVEYFDEVQDDWPDEVKDYFNSIITTHKDVSWEDIPQ